MRYQLINPMSPTLTPIQQVLVNRGIKLEDIPRIRFPSDDEILDPLLLDNMKIGVQMLISHIAQGDRVLVQQDSDADGMTSAAALINYLNRLFPHFVQTKLTYRVHNGKQHGLLVETIPEDVKLVIVPDAGSEQEDVHKELFERGVDVLILDHHHSLVQSKYACVINNQLCDYPNKTLSGAGVVYKFCSYIDSLLGVDYADEIIDLATVGILSDVMVLTEPETRAIILRGMKEFKNPLLKTMVEKDNFHFGGKELTPFNITWYISPYLNAICRSGTIAEKELVFEAMIDFLAYEAIPSTKRGCAGQYETRVDQAVRTCTNVKNRQTKAKDAAVEAVSAIIEQEHLTNNKVIAVRLDPKYAVDKNLTGLLGSSFSDQFKRPVLILNKVVENNEVFWRGSARGYDNANLGSFRDAMLDSGLVDYASGHDSAFGASISDKNFASFIEHFNELYRDFDCSPIYNVDFIWEGNEAISAQLFGEIADEEKLWGKGIEAPIIAIEGFRVYGSQLNLYGLDKGKPTINIRLDDGSSLVKFKSSEEEYENLHSDLGYVIINAVGTCSRNNWGIPQYQILDYEIVGRNEYYF